MLKTLPDFFHTLLCRTKKKFSTILIFSILLLGQNCLPYLFHLGKEQSSIILSREKLEDSLENPNYDEIVKNKLKLIREARTFAIEKLALNKKGGFEYFSKLNRSAIGWNVSASKPLLFESYTWWFPFAGTVPYKGFFNKDMALKLERELKEEGYDTRIREIGGYSTLGWFSDPILSPQLSWPNHRLVGLVFHEMAHATAYLPGDTDLNESYASYVEDKGIELFYKSLEGIQSENLKKFQTEKDIKKKSIKLLKKYADTLDAVYKSDLSDSEKLKIKKEKISEFKKEVFEQKLIPEGKYQEFLKREWNNEDFLGALRYNSGETNFEHLFANSNSDFEIFHKKVREVFELSPEERKVFLSNTE